jgi:phosphoribosylglycinamide formyltransferase 1
MLNLAVFVSGNGSNFRSIHAAILDGRLQASVELVVSSRSDAPALDYARENEIPTFVETPDLRRTEDYPRILTELLLAHGVDFIALCGYLKLIPSQVVKAFPHRILNIHPALLPSFGGKGMYGHHVHEAVVLSGAKFSGATVHLVDEEYDRGPIVLQDVVSVDDTDTPVSLAAKVLKVEHAIYPKALQLFAGNQIRIHGLRTFIQP